MSNSITLLADLRAAGLTATVAEGRLSVGPRDRLTPALREQIAAHRAALLALLAAETMPESLQDGPHAPMPATAKPQPTDAGNGHPDAIRHTSPYGCWHCNGIATGPWQQIGPDAWQAECDGGHPIQRTSASFTEPPEVLQGLLVALPAACPTEPLPLWLYERVHGIEPATPAPEHLTPAQIATAVDAARQQYRQIVYPGVLRYRPRPQPYRDPDRVARILDAGERLGWPALALRPGERLAAGQACWQTFVKAAPPDRLIDAERVLLALEGEE